MLYGDSMVYVRRTTVFTAATLSFLAGLIVAFGIADSGPRCQETTHFTQGGHQ